MSYQVDDYRIAKRTLYFLARLGLLALVLGGIWLIVLAARSLAQEAKPTPIPATAEEWFNWFREQKLVKERVSEVYDKFGRTSIIQVTLPDEVRPKNAPASVSATATYSPLKAKDGQLRGLLKNGWTYQTSASTDIGTGAPTVKPFSTVAP